MDPRSPSCRPARSRSWVVKVTIGIPVFNGAEFLEAALDAACTQEWPELEILVADNASTDRSVEIAEARCRADERVRLIRAEENRGAAWNFNRLVEQAKGEFFWWLPHDDVLEPRAVELCVQLAYRGILRLFR